MRSGGESDDALARAGHAGSVSLALLFDRLVLLSPQVEPTQQSGCVFDSFFLECDHRTGGRMFFVSRTIGHDQPVAGQLFGVIADRVRGNQLRAGNVSHVVRVLAAHVHDKDFPLF